MWLHKQSPATLRVIAAAKLLESRFGEPPSADVVLGLAASEPHANARAALIIVRHEFLADDGETVVPLFKADAAMPPVTVADLDTLWALGGLGRRPLCKLRQPGGSIMPRGHLLWAAQRWEQWASDPYALATTREPLRSVLAAAAISGTVGVQ